MKHDQRTVGRVLSLLVLFSALGPSVYAIDLSIATATSRDGSVAGGHVGWWRTETYGSTLDVEFTTNRTIGDFAGQAGSLSVSEEWDAVMELAPIQVRRGPLSVGAGVYSRFSDTRERGNFVANVQGTQQAQQFDNHYRAQVVGPAAFAAVDVTHVTVPVQAAIMIAPFFAYHFSQDVSLNPLISGSSSLSYWNTGYPMVSADLETALGRMISVRIIADYVRLPFRLLAVTTDDSGISGFESQDSDISDVALRNELTIALPVGPGTAVELGGALEIGRVYNHSAEEWDRSDPTWYVTARVSGR